MDFRKKIRLGDLLVDTGTAHERVGKTKKDRHEAWCDAC